MLFIHPNFPGQFKRLAHSLTRVSGVRVHTLGDASWMTHGEPFPEKPADLRMAYPAIEPPAEIPHPYIKAFDAGVRRGQQVIRHLLPHKHQGLEPDVIYVHTGWGDALYLKELFPNSQIVGLFEYYYHPRGADVGFDPEFPSTFDDIFRVRTLNSIQQMSLESCDIRLCPTPWQRSRYPEVWRDHMRVLHEGVDTTAIAPNPDAVLHLAPNPLLPNGLTLKAGDEVLTYVSRTLEPYRGFHQFMRALPIIQKLRPHCQTVIVGSDRGTGYGPGPRAHPTWKAQLLEELGTQIDTSRVHFTGVLPFDDYVKVLQISRVHVYLTYPFVLSWSAIEAMSAGCLLLASDTEPVRDVLCHLFNGLLVDFFDTRGFAALAADALANPAQFDALRQQARQTAESRFDFTKVIYPQHADLLAAYGFSHHPTSLVL